MSEFDDGWLDFEFEEDDLARQREADSQRATTDPSFDYFIENRPRQPKFTIGQYVAEQGFRVPIIETQAAWEAAFDDETAMLRSEMPQDYDGLTGLLSSERLVYSPWKRAKSAYSKELGGVILRGLRSGELDPTTYMTYMRLNHGWASSKVDTQQLASMFGVECGIWGESASRWRHVPGDNVIMFGDPHVAGRYYFGVDPWMTSDHDYESVGGYMIDADKYDEPFQFSKPRRGFTARPFVDLYERIQQLPLFDNTVSPVLELQRDSNGDIHFLQYLKTRQRHDFVEPFDLPSGNDVIKMDNVRGITSPEGRGMCLFITPERMPDRMRGQAIFCSLIRPLRLHVQLASEMAGFVLHEAYISFKDNHFNSSPLYRPPLAAGLTTGEYWNDPLVRKFNHLLMEASFARDRDHDAVDYVDIKVTSNGRQATIETDGLVHTVGYDDL